MRVALFGDVHGNTVALDAVLTDIERRAVDLVVCVGDIAANGPDPGGALDRVRERADVTVMGNVDAGTVEPPEWWRDPSLREIPDVHHPGILIGVWAAEVVDDDQRAWLAALPLTASVDLDGAQLVAYHGSPRSFDDYLTAWTSEEEVAEMVGDVEGDVLVGGHTHVPMLRRWGGRTLVNTGSVGLPFARYGAAGAVDLTDRAAYAIVERDDDGLHVEHREVPIDADAVRALVRGSDMPFADWWLAQWPV